MTSLHHGLKRKDRLGFSPGLLVLKEVVFIDGTQNVGSREFSEPKVLAYQLPINEKDRSFCSELDIFCTKQA